MEKSNTTVNVFKAQNGVETFKTSSGFVFFNFEQGIDVLGLNSKEKELIKNSFHQSVILRKDGIDYCSVGAFVYFVCANIKQIKTSIKKEQFVDFIFSIYESTNEGETKIDDIPKLLIDSINSHFINQCDEIKNGGENELNDESKANAKSFEQPQQINHEEERMNEIDVIEESMDNGKGENLVKAQSDEPKAKKEKRSNDKMKIRFEALANYKQSEAFKQMVQSKNPNLIFEDAIKKVCEISQVDRMRAMKDVCDAKVGTRLNCFTNSALEQYKDSGYFVVERLKVGEYEFAFHFATPKGVEFLTSLIK